MSNSSVCLSFVFNHQFEENITTLRSIYGKRFSSIYFLSPFSDWNQNKEIIPIFETSVHFQGYFAQAYSYLPKDYDYYAFCADDLFLNPNLNEENLIEKLACENSGYMKYLNPVWDHSFAWHKFEECNFFPSKENMVPYQQFLPTRENLLRKYSSHGFHYSNLGVHNFYGVHQKEISTIRLLSGAKFFLRRGFKRFVNYPLIEGYSDLVVIPNKNLKEFCFYCGVFAAMNLWVDAAVATALVLSCEKVVDEKNSGFHGREIWSKEELKNFSVSRGWNLEELENSMDPEELYVHPIKLSRWSKPGN